MSHRRPFPLLLAAALLAGLLPVCAPTDDYYLEAAAPPEGRLPGSTCGDAIIQAGEDCDGAVVGGARCDTLGFVAGALQCSPACRFDTSGCVMVPPPGCGNRVADPGEECDGTDFARATCLSLGAVSGDLACTPGCLIDGSGCVFPTCGDGHAEGAEACDSEDLGRATCQSEGFASGTLSCSADCGLVTTACVAPPSARCGDGVVQELETCDGADLAGATCESEGFASGTLSCSPECKLVTAGCLSSPRTVCGDGKADGDEACDGADLRGGSCTGLEFGGGTLACGKGCTFDTRGCMPGPACDYEGGSGTGVVLRANTTEHMNRPRMWMCSPGGAGPDLSVAWTAPTTGCFQALVSSERELDAILGVFSSCDRRKSLACDDNSGPDQFPRLEFQATAGTTYALVVDGFHPHDAGPVLVRVTPCAPPEWTCEPGTFGREDGCDCGCGALDPDCDGDASVSACDFCDTAGSCATRTSCDGIQGDANWTCD